MGGQFSWTVDSKEKIMLLTGNSESWRNLGFGPYSYVWTLYYSLIVRNRVFGCVCTAYTIYAGCTYAIDALFDF